MHAERLLRIAELLVAELNDYRLLPLLNELQQALEGGRHDDVAPLLDQIHEISGSAPSNAWPPSQRLILSEIGGNGLVGLSAWTRLEAFMKDYRLSPKAAAALVTELHGEILNFEGTLKNFANSARRLRREPDVLPPGTCEIGVLYPFPELVPDVEAMHREFKALDDALRVFGELGGSAGSLRIRNISTSDLSVFLAASAATGALVAKAIEKILDLLKKRLEIKALRLQLEKMELEIDAAKRLQEREARLMEQGIDDLTDEIIEICHIDDEGRRNELRISTGHSLRFMVMQAERGVVFEVAASLRTSSGAQLEEASERGDEYAVEARHLALAAEHGAAMTARALERGRLAIPEVSSADSTKRDDE